MAKKPGAHGRGARDTGSYGSPAPCSRAARRSQPTAPHNAATPHGGAACASVATHWAKRRAETTLCCVWISESWMKKPLSFGHSGLSLFPKQFSFSCFSLPLLQTLFFLPHGFLLFFLLKSNGRHCPVFTAACLQLIVLAAFASSPAHWSLLHHEWALHFRSLALGTRSFPFQWLLGFSSSAGTSS